MKRIKPYDKEEQDLMKSIQKGLSKRISKNNFFKELEKIPKGARNVTIHMQNEDIEGMKKKAEEAGLPYQTLINTIIHRYLNGGVILKKAF